jgi:hypothetical protein
MGKRRMGTVSVDVWDVIDQIDDEALLEEVKERKLAVGGGPDFVPEDELRDAYAELLRNRPAEALAILDRLLNPKWGSTKAAEAALRSASR